MNIGFLEVVERVVEVERRIVEEGKVPGDTTRLLALAEVACCARHELLVKE